MSALWMLYAVAVAALLSLGAAAAERALRAAGRPGRGAWVVAIAGSWALPVMALLGWVGSDGAEAAATPTFTATEITVTEVATAGQGAVATTPWWEAVVDASREALLAPAAGRIATLAWVVLAALGLLVVGISVARLFRRSRRWPTASVLDEPVRLSPDFGPAVLGVFRPRIVLPRWILSLGEAPLRLILEHEREHRSARDTLVLTAATVATLAAPWNLPLWWQLRRLRMAVELDCDRRVLGRGAPVREYGELLMTVGGRISHLAVPAAALSEKSSFLERRLKTMTQRRTHGWQWKAAAGMVFAGAMIVAACETPAPTNLNEPRPAGDEAAAAVEGEEATAGVIREREVAEGSEAAGSQVRARIEEIVGDGVAVLGDDGELGAALTLGVPVGEGASFEGFEMRGTGSPSDAHFDPLVYVNGVRVDQDLDDLEIEPEEIHRIEIIKGEAAAQIVGPEAAGGVIQIFTKEWVAENEPENDPDRVAERRTIRERPSTLSPPDQLGAENRPLIYLDGVRIDGAGLPGGDAATSILNSIDPEDIDRIEVTKGAAAAEIYGAEANGGVIQIYTKGGGGAREPEAGGEFQLREIREWEGGEEAGGGYRFEARVLGPDEEPEGWRMRMAPADPDAAANATARFTPDTIRATGVIRPRR